MFFLFFCKVPDENKKGAGANGGVFFTHLRSLSVALTLFGTSKRHFRTYPSTNKEGCGINLLESDNALTNAYKTKQKARHAKKTLLLIV